MLWVIDFVKVKKCYPKRKIPKMTKKKLVGNLDPEFVHKRCKKLETYLNEIAKLPGVFDLQFMKEFVNQTEVPPKLKKKDSSDTSSSEKSPR
jgi:hypothetical protein